MLSAILGGVGRWLFVIAIGLATFWPDFGVVALGWRFFSMAPLPVIAFGCAWSVLLALALPLTLNQFRVVSGVAVGGIYVVGAVSAYLTNALNLAEQWWLGLVGFVFVVFGWLTVCTKLWRWARGVVAVQDESPAA